MSETKFTAILPKEYENSDKDSSKDDKQNEKEENCCCKCCYDCCTSLLDSGCCFFCGIFMMLNNK
jgi:hypothetical protein